VSIASPTIMVSVDRRLVDELLPGAIAEAEQLAAGFSDSHDRRAWVAGRLGRRLEPLLELVTSGSEVR